MTIIADYPAYTIVANDGREFKPGEEIAIPYQSQRYGTLWNFFCLGSVASEAERYNENVNEAVERAKSFGHDLYYAFGLGVTLTAEPQAKKTVTGFNYGDTIRFAGKTFRIDRAPNQNVKLVEQA